MVQSTLRGVFPVAIAIIAWGAIILQFVLTLQTAVENGRSAGWGIMVYLGYFTILTNILVALAISLPLVAPESKAGRFFRGSSPATAVGVAIIVVGIGYHLLLRSIWEPQGLQLLADIALHYVMPILYTGYWIWLIPKDDLRWQDIPKWALYPIGYFVYALLRGMWIGVYPYPFIDVGVLGFGTAFVNASGVLIGFLVVSAVLVVLGRMWPGNVVKRDIQPKG